MKARIAWGMAVCVILFSAAVQAQPTNEAQYRAAITKLFLSNYYALPLIRLNPVFPGDLITLGNETVYVNHDVCYPGLKVGNYRAIPKYQGKEALSLSGNLVVAGQVLSKKIAEVEANVKAKFGTTATINLDPLALDQVDAVTLKSARIDSKCDAVHQVLKGKPNGKALVQQVLHGRVALGLYTTFDSSLDAKAKAEGLKRLAGVLNIKEAEIALAGQLATFTVSESPAAMSLAIVPYGYNREEVARITNYLQGRRGANLEIAVREAITVGDVGQFEKAVVWVQELLGKDEIVNKERWAERVLGTDSPEELTKAGSEKASFQTLGNYGAGMELLRQEAPRRERLPR